MIRQLLPRGSIRTLAPPFVAGLLVALLAGPSAAQDRAEEIPAEEVSRAFVRALDAELTPAADGITGPRNALGDLLDPNGNPIGQGTVQGLLLIRDTYAEQLEAFADALESTKEGSRPQKVAEARELREKAREVQSAYTNMVAAHRQGTSPYNPRTGRAESPAAEHGNWLRRADEAERLGDAERAAEYRREAARTRYGTFLARRAAFFALLDENPVLGLKKDGKPLFQTLRELEFDRPATLFRDRQVLTQFERDQAMYEVYDAHLAAGIEEARREAESARNITELSDLWKFGSERFTRTHEAAAAKGRFAGSNHTRLMVDEVIGVYAGSEAGEAFWNGVKDLTIAVVGTGGILIPVVGPFITAGAGLLQVYRDGDDLYIAYVEVEEAERFAAVTGHTEIIAVQERAAAAEGMLAFSVATSVIDLTALRSVRFTRLRRADEATDAGRTGARTGGVGAAARAGDDAAADLEEVVRRARAAGIPEEEIARAVARARSQPRITYEVVDRLERDLIVAQANRDRLLVFVSGDEYREFIDFVGDVMPTRLRRTSTGPYQELRTKLTLESSGRPQTWTPEDLRLLDEVVDAGGDARRWAYLDVDEGGFLRIFDEETLAAARRMRERRPRTGRAETADAGDGATTEILRDPDAAAERAFRDAETVIERPRTGTGDSPPVDVGAETVIERPRTGTGDSPPVDVGAETVIERPRTGTGDSPQRDATDAAAAGALRAGRTAERRVPPPVAPPETPEEEERRAGETGTAGDAGAETAGAAETAAAAADAETAAVAAGGGLYEVTEVIPPIEIVLEEEVQGDTPDDSYLAPEGEVSIGLGIPAGAAFPVANAGTRDPLTQLMFVEAVEMEIAPASTGDGALPRSPPGRSVGKEGAPSASRDAAAELERELAGFLAEWAGGASDLDVFILGLGESTGDALRIHVLNRGSGPVSFRAEGLVVEPLSLEEAAREELERRLSDLLARNPAVATLEAYCLEFLLRPPSPGTLLRLAPPEVQERFQPMRDVLSTAGRLADAGRLRPDSDPAAYLQSVKQWAIWTLDQRLDASSFARTFVEHTRRNIEESGGEWTREIEGLVHGLTENRWNDIRNVLREAGH